MQQTMNIKEEFKILQRKIHGKPLVYLDSAASAQKPEIVLEGMKTFYETSYANVHRGIYTLAEEATAAYEDARQKVAKFVHAQTEEIIFTRSTTDSINMIARSLCSTLNEGDEILVSIMEHHSNFVPWQQLAKQYNLVFKTIGTTPDHRLDLEDLKKKINAKTKVIAITHVSNVLGTINPIQEITALAKNMTHNAVVVVDGAQAIAHMPVNVKELDVDFYALSGHKMYGPEGIGVLYGKKTLLEQLPPSTWGGEMVREVTVERTTWNDLPYKFEPGTPDITQAVGLGIAIDFIQRIGFAHLQHHEKELLEYTLTELKKISGLTIIGPQTTKDRSGAISFMMQDLHPHDIAQVLDQEGIAIRAGHHCAQPLHCALGLVATARVSLGIYNTKEDIDKLIVGLHKVQRLLQ